MGRRRRHGGRSWRAAGSTRSWPREPAGRSRRPRRPPHREHRRVASRRPLGRVRTAGAAHGTRIRGVRLRPEAVAGVFGVDTCGAPQPDPRPGRRRGVQAQSRPGRRPGARRVGARVEPDRRAAAAVRLLEHDSVDATADRSDSRAGSSAVCSTRTSASAPKTFQRVLRFQRFVQRTDEGTPLAHAAADAGYSDQAHMSRDVLPA